MMHGKERWQSRSASTINLWLGLHVTTTRSKEMKAAKAMKVYCVSYRTTTRLE